MAEIAFARELFPAGHPYWSPPLDEIETPYPFEHRIEDVAAHCAFPMTHLGLAYSMALRYAPPAYGGQATELRALRGLERITSRG